MPQNEPVARIELRRESELQRCLRIYKNDSLIAWHLGISKAEVAAARLKLRPQKVYGSWISGGEIGTEEYERRRKTTKAANRRFVKALKQAQANG
jgi:hypothetical protein